MHPQFTAKCPTCGAEMPVNFGFRIWCDRCNYNLEYVDELGWAKPEGMFPRLWAWMSKRSGEKIYREVMKVSDLRPRLTLSFLLAFLISSLVLGGVILMVVIAVTLIYWTVRDPGSMTIFILCGRLLGALFLLYLVWIGFPRFSKMDRHILHRKNAVGNLKQLFDLCDRISSDLKTPKVASIHIAPEFNSGIEKVGWKRETVLHLGLPCLLSLNSQELVALISHELAHSANGDLQNGLITGSAISYLTKWSDHFSIKYVEMNRPSLAATINLIIFLVARLLSLFFWLGGFLLASLTFQNIRREEYYADLSASKLAGTKSFISLLHKLYLEQAFIKFIQNNGNDPNIRIIQEVRELMCNVPDREWLRIERLIAKEAKEGSYKEGRHSSISRRISVLEARPVESGEISFNNGVFHQIMDELQDFDGLIEQEIRASIT